jgi:hypothetical protein
LKTRKEWYEMTFLKVMMILLRRPDWEKMILQDFANSNSLEQ